MFRAMHYMGRGIRAMDLVEKMAERRERSLAGTRRPSFIVRMARTLFAPAMSAGGSQAEGRA